MGLLKPKKHIINSKGEQEDLNIYSTRVEACDIDMPCKQIEVMIDGVKTIGYLGLTDEIDKTKASSKRVQIGDKIYAERKYMGVRSMCNWLASNYPDTCETMEEIPEGELPDTSDCQDFSYTFSRGRKLDHMAELDTAKGINFEGMFNFNEYRSILPTMDTSRGTNFSRFVDSCIALLTLNVDTSNGENFEAFAHNCPELIEINNLNTSKAKNISRLVDECRALTDISPISLKSLEYEDLMNYDKGLYAFRNTNSLGDLTFNDVPIGLLEEDLRQSMSIMPSCKTININYRNAIVKSPIEIVKSINNELLENNTSNNKIILLRDGNKPLSEYIKHKEIWGTVYSDGLETQTPINFGCFITPNNEIYIGNSYENIIDTTVNGKYGVMGFVNGDLDIHAVEDTETNELKCIRLKSFSEGDYIISYETDDNFSIEGIHGVGVNGFDIIKDETNKKVYMFHLDSTATELIFKVKDGSTHKIGFETLLKKAMIVKSSVELPYIPIDIIIPKTKLVFDNQYENQNDFKNLSFIFKGIDFGKNATFNLFSRQLGNNGLTCIVENYKLDIDLLFNHINGCITKGLTDLNSKNVMDFKTFEVVGDTSGKAITTKSINIFEGVLTKDELRKTLESIE